MLPKPKHLGPEYGAQFGDDSVVAAYRFRPPYPAEVFDILVSLMGGESRAVLDLGCGCGDLARPLASRAEVGRVDALDISAPMIALGRMLPGGDQTKLRWIEGPGETAPFDPPYALVTAAESLHWMDWEVILPRLRESLVSEGLLALVARRDLSTPPWMDRVIPIVSEFSTNKDFQPYNLIAELERRRLFESLGRAQTAPIRFSQSLDDYVESWHSRNGLSRERMTEASGGEFDRRMRDALGPFLEDGWVSFDLVAAVIWGLPAPLNEARG